MNPVLIGSAVAAVLVLGGLVVIITRRKPAPKPVPPPPRRVVSPSKPRAQRTAAPTTTGDSGTSQSATDNERAAIELPAEDDEDLAFETTSAPKGGRPASKRPPEPEPGPAKKSASPFLNAQPTAEAGTSASAAPTEVKASPPPAASAKKAQPTYADTIGIDLGTTNSCCAVCTDMGQVLMIPTKGGENTMPSIIAVDDRGNELVGHDAKRQWLLNPDKTVYGAKRFIGRQFSSGLIKNMQSFFSYELNSDAQGNVTVGYGDKKLSLEEVSAKLLNSIRSYASDYLNKPIRKAVVTVPAFFNERQRQAVRRAGDLIDLEIVRLVNEPTAAAMAYGIRGDTDKNVAIYDLGGGTFDVSVVSIHNKVFEVKATGGDVVLGGIDWDNALIKYLTDGFKKQFGIDLTKDSAAMQRIKAAAEDAKRDLAARDNVEIRLPFIAMSPEGSPYDLELTLTREEFNTITRPLVDRTLEIAKEVIDESGLQISDLTDILMVGGQSRDLQVRQAVADFFGIEPAKSVHPDEAVAVGAAMYGYSMETDVVTERVKLLDVVPMAIGVAYADGRMMEIFPKNTPTPVEKEIQTVNVANQEFLEVRVFQGQDPQAANNAFLGTFRLEGVRPAPAGQVHIAVHFAVSVEGTLEVSAMDLDMGTSIGKAVNVEVAR